ncbi:MAG: hypothetical protein ACRDRH_24125 [Pseudonocardia sp.]
MGATGGLPVLAGGVCALLRERFSTISRVWADGGYAGRLPTWAAAVLRLTVNRRQAQRRYPRVRRASPQVGGKRTFGWLNRYRRLVRDYERLPEHHEVMVLGATTMIVTRQLVRQVTGEPASPRWGGQRTRPQLNQQDLQAA